MAAIFTDLGPFSLTSLCFPLACRTRKEVELWVPPELVRQVARQVQFARKHECEYNLASITPLFFPP